MTDLCERCECEIDEGCCSDHDGVYCKDCCHERNIEHAQGWLEGMYED